MKKIYRIVRLLYLIIIICLFGCSSDSSSLSDELKLPEPKSLINLPAGPFIQYMMYWSKDGSQILLQRETWTEEDIQNMKYEYWLFDSEGNALDDTANLDLSNFDIGSEDNTQNSVALNKGEIIWDTCNSKNIVISGTDIFESDNTAWNMNVWKNQEILGSFTFSSEQWMYDTFPSFSPRPSYTFSPNCDFFTVTLRGWTAYEISGDAELWLLDIQNMTFTHAFTGRSGFIKLWDDPVQSVFPNWSPIENKFVFGGGKFGVEIFDLETKERKWLIQPKASVQWYKPQWSPSGNWIALTGGNESPSIMIINPDGKNYATTGACYLTDIQWSPKKDNLAYLCESDIPESHNVWLRLWIWNISEYSDNN